MRRARSKKVSENNVLIKIKIIKYKMTMSTLHYIYINVYNNIILIDSVIELTDGTSTSINK
jgi:hypothetical protein